MTIGLPRALLYHRYKVLWETFFKCLGCDVVVSENTNKKILADGINFSIDESCLPAKIFMGHVFSLAGRCDYVLVPRVCNYGKSRDVCVKFNAMYDIVKNTFEGLVLLDYNIDELAGKSEKTGFLGMGRVLGKSRIETRFAYKTAKKAQKEHENSEEIKQKKAFLANKKPKILIISHHYITHDKLLGYPVIEYIKKQGGEPVFAGACNKNESARAYKELSETLYWEYSKELVGSVYLLKDKVDGIILLTAFPCGPDSLVNELLTRKIKDVPLINIVLDELSGDAGLQTRIESFMDIINAQCIIHNA